MPTMTAAPTMTGPERLATEAFHADLLAEWDTIAQAMYVANSLGDASGERECAAKISPLYREIKEVEFCLASNVLPF